MKSDFRTRNYSSLVFRGLRDRFHKAKFGYQMLFILSAMWDATELPMRPTR
jgi:hypothetical protein